MVTESDRVIFLTPEAIPGLTEKIANDLAVLGFPQTARQSLEDFFKALHGELSVSAVALVSATARIPGPDLIVHVLLVTPEDENIDRVGGYYDGFSLALRRAAAPDYYGADLQIEGPPLDSAHVLRDKLVRRFGEGVSAGVIAVATLIRPKSQP